MSLNFSFIFFLIVFFLGGGGYYLPLHQHLPFLPGFFNPLFIFLINTIFHMFKYFWVLPCNSFVNNNKFAIFHHPFYHRSERFKEVYPGSYHSYYWIYIHNHLLIVQFFSFLFLLLPSIMIHLYHLNYQHYHTEVNLC